MASSGAFLCRVFKQSETNLMRVTGSAVGNGKNPAAFLFVAASNFHRFRSHKIIRTRHRTIIFVIIPSVVLVPSFNYGAEDSITAHVRGT